MSLSASTRLPRIPKIALGSLITAMTIVPVVIGLASPAMANGQSDSANKQTNKQVNTAGSITCVFASVEYPEGTVIQEDGGPEQMCARVLNPNWFFELQNKPDAPQYSGEWIRTSKDIRERSRSVVRLPQPPPFVCRPKVETQEKLCSCEGSSPFSQNSVVNSANGKLRCDQGKWVPLAQLRLKLFGFGQARAGADRRAFLSDGDAVYVVAEGDTVLGYRIIKINHTNL